MKQKRLTYIKNILLPCFVFSLITGIFTGILIFPSKRHQATFSVFQPTSTDTCAKIPYDLPCLIVGAAAVGLLSAFILDRTKNCRGGGIPTSVAIVL